MRLAYLAPLYIGWHYSGGLNDLYLNWRNFIHFTLHFFSIGFLFRTLFAPFGRLNEEYQKGLDAEAFFETLVVNTLMRLVGFVLRTFVIFVGLLVLLLVAALGPLVIVLWMLAPFVIASLFVYELSYGL